MRTPLVSLRHVSVSYDGHEALQGVDLDIYSDDFLGIIGPNGGGKTTLVKAIVGNVPYRGTITYSQELYRGGERLIGYMPQLSVFDRSFPISVLEVVLSGLQGQKGLFSRYTAKDRRHAEAVGNGGEMGIELILRRLEEHRLEDGDCRRPHLLAHPGDGDAFPCPDGPYSHIYRDTAVDLVDYDLQDGLLLILIHHVELAVGSECEYATDTAIDKEVYVFPELALDDMLILIYRCRYRRNNSFEETILFHALS